MGEQYQYIFTAFGIQNLNNIIQESNTNIPNLLLEIMSIEAPLVEDQPNQDLLRVKARNQLGFWKLFLRALKKLQPENYKYEKMRQFEQVFVKLLDMTVRHFEIGYADVFVDFNKEDIDSEIFDDYYSNKRDLGKIVRETTMLVGAQQVI